MLSSIESYSQFIYTFLDETVTVQRHTLRIYPRGVWLGVLEGVIEFERGAVLRIYERLDFARQRILVYSYEVWQNQQQLYWYDPQEHPNDPDLASSFPHHKHVHPDPSTGFAEHPGVLTEETGQSIKRHRIPAPELSFTEPNLPFLIREIEQLLKN